MHSHLSLKIFSFIVLSSSSTISGQCCLVGKHPSSVWLAMCLQVQRPSEPTPMIDCVDLTPLGKLQNIKRFTLHCDWPAPHDVGLRLRFGMYEEDEQQQCRSSTSRRSSRRHSQQQQQVGHLTVMDGECFLQGLTRSHRLTHFSEVCCWVLGFRGRLRLNHKPKPRPWTLECLQQSLTCIVMRDSRQC